MFDVATLHLLAILELFFSEETVAWDFLFFYFFNNTFTGVTGKKTVAITWHSQGIQYKSYKFNKYTRHYDLQQLPSSTEKHQPTCLSIFLHIK